jgi:hypothetical protein
MEPKIKLLDRMRNVMRLKHMSLRTEEAYVSWVKRFIEDVENHVLWAWSEFNGFAS